MSSVEHERYLTTTEFHRYHEMLMAQLREMKGDMAERFEHNEASLGDLRSAIDRAAGRDSVQDFRDLDRRIAALERAKEFLGGKLAMVGALVGSLGGLAGIATLAWNLLKASGGQAGK